MYLAKGDYAALVDLFSDVRISNNKKTYWSFIAYICNILILDFIKLETFCCNRLK